jgi:hypothetical protein
MVQRFARPFAEREAGPRAEPARTRAGGSTQAGRGVRARTRTSTVRTTT